MEPQIGIYKITNKINGKIYIGQSTNIQRRWSQHKSDAFRETAHSYHTHLYSAMRKYGFENFEFSIIEECLPEELNDREIYWIDYYDSLNNEKGYNLRPGGNAPVKIIPEKIIELWNDKKSVAEIQEYFNVSRSTVLSWLKKCTDYTIEESRYRSNKNKLASTEKAKIIKEKLSENKKINQYTMKGEFIKSWDSLLEIKKFYNSPSVWQGVKACLFKEYYSSHGFRWAYEDEDLTSKDTLKEKAKGTKLSSQQVEEIKKLIAEGISQPKIAEIFNISRHVITAINCGKNWKDDGIYPIYDYKNKKSNR